MGYLSGEKEYNTFLLADLRAYGFDMDCQDVWMDMTEGRCCCVYLRYYNNLLIYSREDHIDKESLDFILQNHHILVIMGKEKLLSQAKDMIGKDYLSSSKQLYRLPEGTIPGTSLKGEQAVPVKARLEDVDDIYTFLGSIPQISGLYRSKEMIRDRIMRNEGVHLFVRKDGRIISHGNSTTGSDETVMIGGVATDPDFRDRGLASMIVSMLSKIILDQGKIPCLFSGADTQTFFERLGFERLGGWTTLERMTA